MPGLKQFLVFVGLVGLVRSGSDKSPQEEINSNVEAKISPRQPLAAPGHDLTLNCKLRSSNGNISSDQFQFLSEELNLTEIGAIQSVLDDKTLQLVIRNVSRSMPSGKISCHWRNLLLDEVSVTFSDRPLPPTNPKCQVLNWQAMICEWEVPDTGFEINVTLSYSRSYSCRHKRYYRCPHLNFDAKSGIGSCQWLPHDHLDRFLFIDHCIVTTVESSLGKILGKYPRVQVDKIVKPDPVRSLSYYVNGSRSATVRWESQYSGPPFKLIRYRVSYSAPGRNGAVNETTDTQIVLADLDPSTEYTVTVDCIPLLQNQPVGFWSRSQSVVFQTKPSKRR